MSETPAQIAARRRAMRLRRSNFPTPPRDRAQRQASIMHPAFLALGRESAVAFLNAEPARLDGRRFDPVTESETHRANAEAEMVHRAPRAPAEET